MKVKVKSWSSEYEEAVENYIGSALESSRGGAVEAAAQGVENIAYALGRLVELLMDKGILDLEDLDKIAGPYAPTVIGRVS